MTTQRRLFIEEIVEQLGSARQYIQDVLDSEEEDRANIPEGYEDSQKAEDMDRAIRMMDIAIGLVDEAIADIQYL